MSITESDVRLRASARMTDFTNGGGPMSTTVIVDGVNNNVFDNITDLERLDGKLSLRKVFGAALNNDTSVYLSAHMIVDQPPTDTATSCFAFSYGNATTERAAAVAAFEAWHRVPGGLRYGFEGTAGSNTASMRTSIFLGPSAPAVGMTFGLNAFGGSVSTAGDITERVTVIAVAFTGTDFGGGAAFGSPTCNNYAVTLSKPLTNTITGPGTYFPPSANAAAGVEIVEYRPYGVGTAAGGISSGSSTAALDTVKAQVAPFVSGGIYPTDNLGIDPAPFAYQSGSVPAIRTKDKVLVHSTIGMTPATISNGQTVTTGRTTLSRLRVIGNNGTVHGTFTRGQTAPTGLGFTADLDAGTVTFSSVSGLSQPVTVEHRIEELLRVTGVSGITVTFNRGLSRAYPAGTRVSSLLTLGDLQARVSLSFAQTTWTGAYADTVTGSSPAADYNVTSYPIAVVNKGSVGERWALIFTNTTSYRIVGELLGEIGTGTIGADCAPNNPATGVPYFTILASGWGSGWAAGNVYRFNTLGANSPVWVGRCVAPSTPSGSDAVTLQLRGYVN